MAVNVTNDYRTTIYSGERIYSCSLHINGVEISPRQIKEIKISRPIIDKTKESFYIGTFIANKIEVTFKNKDNLDIVSGYEVNLTIALKVNNTDEWVNQGTFVIDDLGENYQKTNKITCYDYSTKFEPAVDAKIEDVFNYDEENLTYSITLENLLKWLCQHYGIELGTYPNVNRETTVGNWDSTLSGKQYISWIAEIMAGNAKIGRDNKLYIIPLKSDPVYIVNALRSKSIEIGEKYHISHVVYFDALRNFTFPLANMFNFVLKIEDIPIDIKGCTAIVADDTYYFTSTGGKISFGSIVESGKTYYTNVGSLYPVFENDDYTFYCTNEVFDDNYITAYDKDKKSLGYTKVLDGQPYKTPVGAKYISVKIGIPEASIENVGEVYETSLVLKRDVEEQNTLQIRQDNLFIVSEAEIENIYNAVHDFEIYSLKNTNWGDLSLDGYDIITYQLGTQKYSTFYNPEITYSQSVMDSTEVKIPTKQQEVTTNRLQLSADASVRKTLTEVNSLTGKVTILSERTTENTRNIASLVLADNEIKTSISQVTTSTNEQINELTTALNETKTSTYTKTEIQQIANGSYKDENGNAVTVSSVINMSGTFDIDGMHYRKTNANTETTINQEGLEVDDTKSNAELLYAGYDSDQTSVTYGSSVVRTENLTVRNYLRCGEVGRFEKYTDSQNHTGVGFFLEG